MEDMQAMASCVVCTSRSRHRSSCTAKSHQQMMCSCAVVVSVYMNYYRCPGDMLHDETSPAPPP